MGAATFRPTGTRSPDNCLPDSRVEPDSEASRYRVANLAANLTIRGPSSNRWDSTPARTCAVTPLYMAANNPTRFPES